MSGHPPGPDASLGQRAVPYHCPYCAEEDLRPVGATPGAWHCQSCLRSFSVKYLGIHRPAESEDPDLSDTPTLPAESVRAAHQGAIR